MRALEQERKDLSEGDTRVPESAEPGMAVSPSLGLNQSCCRLAKLDIIISL